MKTSNHCFGAIGVALPFALALSTGPTVTAQTIWTRAADNSIALEVLKPDFEGNSASTSLLTSVWVATLRYGVGPNVKLVADIPFANFGSDFSDGETALGNPYLGVEVKRPGSSFVGEFGARLPLTPDLNTASIVGAFTELERWEAFLPDVLSLFFVGNFVKEYPSGLYTRFRVGPSVLVPTKSGPDKEIFAVYGGLLGYAGNGLDISGGFSGRAILTQDNLDIGERSLHEAGINLGYTAGKIQPSIQIRVPLDSDLSDITDFSYGIGVSIELP